MLYYYRQDLAPWQVEAMMFAVKSRGSRGWSAHTLKMGSDSCVA